MDDVPTGAVENNTGTASYIYKIKLECNHEVYTPVLLRLQYPDDTHFILCPLCVMYGEVRTTNWKPVVGYEEVEDNALMRDVLGGLPFIMPRDILRIQPSVPPNRCRPFPYVGNRGKRRIELA